MDQAPVWGLGALKDAPEICSLKDPQALDRAHHVVGTRHGVLTTRGRGEKGGEKVLLCPRVGHAKGQHFRETQ